MSPILKIIEKNCNRNVISQNGIANPKKDPTLVIIILNYQQPIQNPFYFKPHRRKPGGPQAHPALVLALCPVFYRKTILSVPWIIKTLTCKTDWDKFLSMADCSVIE